MSNDGAEDFGLAGLSWLLQQGLQDPGSSPRALAKMYLHLGLKSVKFPGPKSAKPLGVSLHVTFVTGAESLKYLQLELFFSCFLPSQMFLQV